MIMTMVVIKKFTHYMSIATKTMTTFLKNKFKKTIFVAFQDDKKRILKFNFRFSFKNRSFFIILPTKLISLNCTTSQKFPS